MAANTAATAKKTETKTESGQKKADAKKNQQESLLEKLFIDMLKDMYWAEKHLATALNKMHSEATTPELQDAFEDHKYVTQKHASRLEKIFKMMGKEPEGKKCEAMEGLTNEANTLIKETTEGTMTRDAALIIAAQKIEHYEIASYGSLVQVAKTIDREDVARLLEKTLWEEEDTDELLTEIAETYINPMADNESDDDEEDEEVEETTATSKEKK
jgi:ferritin-like metal-binding protein YciE